MNRPIRVTACVKKRERGNKSVAPEWTQEPFFPVLQEVPTQQKAPAASCRRLAKSGGQLPGVCLLPPGPALHSAQTRGVHCTTAVLLSG